MSAVRVFALVIGVIFLLVGILGFIPGLVTAPPPTHHLAVESFHGYLLGLFPINLLHNLVHLAVGAAGVLSSRSFHASRAFSKGLAILYGVLAVLGLFPALNTLFGLVPIHGNDIWLHAGTAIIAAYFGWAHAPRTTGEAETTTTGL